MSSWSAYVPVLRNQYLFAVNTLQQRVKNHITQIPKNVKQPKSEKMSHTTTRSFLIPSPFFFFCLLHMLPRSERVRTFSLGKLGPNGTQIRSLSQRGSQLAEQKLMLWVTDFMKLLPTITNYHMSIGPIFCGKSAQSLFFNEAAWCIPKIWSGGENHFKYPAEDSCLHSGPCLVFLKTLVFVYIVWFAN